MVYKDAVGEVQRREINYIEGSGGQCEGRLPREEVMFCQNTEGNVRLFQELGERRKRKSSPDGGNNEE